MRADVESRLYRAGSWIGRASESSDHLDGQFIFYWIALNALYGQRGSESGPPRDREDLRAFLGRIAGCGGDAAVSLTEALETLKSEIALLLESEFLYEEYWIFGYTDSVAGTIDRATRRLRSWPNRDFARDLINVFDRLGTLRNQMVHGSSKDGSGANRASVEPAVRILAQLVPVFCSVVRGRMDEDWGPLPFPAKGRDGHSGQPPNEMTDTVRWRTIQQGIAARENCIRGHSELVGSPLAVGEIVDPPATVDVLFVGVAPTSLNGKHKGRHFWSNVNDPLRIGLFSVLDELFDSQLRAINGRSKSAADDDFRARKLFFVHSCKVRPVPAKLKAPPEVVIASCARRHLAAEIIAIRARAVCFLGHNTAPAAASLGLAVDDRIVTAKVTSEMAEWTGLGLATVQPIRGAERRAGPAIRRLLVQLGMLEQ